MRTVHGPLATPARTYSHPSHSRRISPTMIAPACRVTLRISLFLRATDISLFFPALKSARYQPPVPQRTRQDRHSVSRYATFYSFNRIPINCTHTHTECRLEFHYVPMDTIISRASINCPNSPHGLFYFENSTATEIRLKFFLLPRFLSRNDRFRGPRLKCLI